MQTKYLRPCCCNRDSLSFDMQHDIVLKKLNFDLLTAGVGGGGGDDAEFAGNIFATMLLHFMIPINLICNMIMF